MFISACCRFVVVLFILPLLSDRDAAATTGNRGSSRLFVLLTRSSTITYVSINSPGTSARITIGAASAADVGGGKVGGGGGMQKTAGHKLGTMTLPTLVNTIQFLIVARNYIKVK